MPSSFSFAPSNPTELQSTAGEVDDDEDDTEAAVTSNKVSIRMNTGISLLVSASFVI